MPDLPTITITTAQANRALAAFGTAENYRVWLRQTVRDYVLNYETNQIREAAQVQVEARIQDIIDNMNL